ncbi:hypothetical protein SAMN05518845_11662 [Variovorax sp. YR750]|uniref:hypothetical protein n=1 Tax=Variovorax sp. YR750 TaxID=1884384 RepID=UPI0008BDB500|nr:hypothetical protein [Variovorax sp. YR750]SEM09986.1 hypothetical protein SAMN05518845_11662 [Variovorax sp. YR750]
MELHKQFKQASTSSQAYFIAGLAGVLGLVLSSGAFSMERGYDTAAYLLSMACFAFGFVVWSMPWLRRAWDHWFGRSVILVLHVFVLLLSAVLSRNIVAEAIGLPPQDFDLSVGFVALAMYPLAWCFVIMIPLGLLAVLFQLGAFVMSTWRRSPDWDVLRQVGHCVGAFAVLGGIAFISDGYSTLQKHAHPAIRWIAFFSDYQTAASYPGMSPNERIRLHENGVISFPIIENGVLRIRTRKYEGS